MFRPTASKTEAVGSCEDFNPQWANVVDYALKFSSKTLTYKWIDDAVINAK